MPCANGGSFGVSVGSGGCGGVGVGGRRGGGSVGGSVRGRGVVGSGGGRGGSGGEARRNQLGKIIDGILLKESPYVPTIHCGIEVRLPLKVEGLEHLVELSIARATLSPPKLLVLNHPLLYH